MQINPLLYSDSTVVFVGDDGRLRNVNLTSGVSQKMGGNLSFVSRFCEQIKLLKPEEKVKYRVMDEWNRLSNQVVNAKTIESLD